jgi:3-oxoacyl-[acyl-carrier protein] reductase
MPNHIALISGTTRGIGRAIAEHLLAMGSVVIGCGRTKATLSHPQYIHHELDLGDPEAVEDFFFEVRGEVTHLDALINNAGIAKMNAFALTPVESVQNIFAVNVYSTFYLSQKAIGLLRRSPHPRIINMSSVAVPLRLEGEAAYAASKSAVEMLTRIIAKELSNFHITCNAIGPSPIATDLIRGVPQDKINRLIQRQAIAKMATVADVIHLVDFLLHPASDMITGQIIYLGGIS